MKDLIIAECEEQEDIGFGYYGECKGKFFSNGSWDLHCVVCYSVIGHLALRLTTTLNETLNRLNKNCGNLLTLCHQLDYLSSSCM